MRGNLMGAWTTAVRMAAVAALAGLICAAGGPLAAAADKGGASPEALFKRAQEAARTKNYVELALCIAPDDLALMDLSLIVAGQLLVSFAQMEDDIHQGMGPDIVSEEMSKAEAEKVAAAVAKAKEEADKMGRALTAVLDTHGLTKKLEKSPTDNIKDEQEMKAAAKELLKGADHAQLFNDLMGFMQQNMDSESKPMFAPDCALKELKIDGGRAAGKCGEEEITFAKTGDRWYLSMPESGPTP